MVTPSQKKLRGHLTQIKTLTICPSSVQAEKKKNDRFKSAIRLTEKNKSWLLGYTHVRREETDFILMFTIKICDNTEKTTKIVLR